MLPHRLKRLQIDLNQHRRWLSAFVHGAQPRSRIESEQRNVLLQHYRPRVIPSCRDGVQQSAPGTVAFASNKVERAKRQKAETERTLHVKDIRERESLNQAIADGDLNAVKEAYYGVENRQHLGHRHTNNIISLLQQRLRSEKWNPDGTLRVQANTEIVEFAEGLVHDIRNGTLQPSPRAHMRLLSIFKESGSLNAGAAFWNWLEGQDERFVNADVYGAAIELLAVQGVPLPELEDLYQQALGRFPGTFASYHLSPAAVLEDRGKPTTLVGMPMVLFQGILTARLLNGDARNAYLALDTALRLYPDQTPPRFFTLFSEERPITESFTVAALALRAGIKIPPGHIRWQLSALRSTPDAVSVKQHPMALRAMLSLIYMYLGAGGSMASNNLNLLVISMTQFMRMGVISDLEPKNKQKVATKVMDIVRKTLAIFARFGARPGHPAFASIILNLGGYGQSKQTIGVALKDMNALGLTPNEPTLTSVIVAAGLLEDADFVRKAWAELVDSKNAVGETPTTTSLHCLIKACHLAGDLDFAQEQVEMYRDHLDEYEQVQLEAGLNDGNSYNLGVADSKDKVDATSILSEIGKVGADLDIIDEKTKDDAGSVQDFSEQKLPMTLLLREETSLPESDIRRIYDEITTERPLSKADTTQAKPESLINPQANESPSPGSMTPTNVPLDTIRYENWKLINWLLETAEASDQRYQAAVDRAIEDRRTPPPRSKTLTSNWSEWQMRSFGLSDLVSSGKEKKERRASEEEVQRAKEKILRLRGMSSLQ